MEPPTKRRKPPSFRWEIPGDDDVKAIMNSKLLKVRETLTRQFNKPVNNRDILEHVLDFWCEKTEQGVGLNPNFTTYQKVDNSQSEELFITCKSSVGVLIDIADNHAQLCSATLKQESVTLLGHVAIVKLTCPLHKQHTYRWSSSPHLSDDKFLVNHYMLHGFATSGILPIQYQRFCQGANIGYMSDKFRKNPMTILHQCIEDEYKESIEEALVMETAMTENVEDGINVMSDARHGWRKNAQDTSVVMIGENSHHVLRHEHVTKQDDPATQRHEALGTERALNHFEGENIGINIWIHDNNATVNKQINSRDLVNQNDLWHGIKNLKRGVKKVTEGPKKNHSLTWHTELDDKLVSIATHTHWAARRSDGNAATLKNSLDTIIPHYKNNHTKCHQSARCKTDTNYEPSKKVITNPKAEKLLQTAITSSTIYKKPENFSYGKDTHYVESFNNVLNIFQDKRISFTSKEYSKRAHLAVLHWNENVDRGYTSEWVKPTVANRRGKTKRNYRATTYKYREKLWKRFMDKI
jgi:hypothetical protein